MTIASCHSKSSFSSNTRKDKGEFKKNLKSSNKEPMNVLIGEPVQISGKPKYEHKKSGFSKYTRKKRPTLKEL